MWRERVSELVSELVSERAGKGARTRTVTYADAIPQIAAVYVPRTVTKFDENLSRDRRNTQDSKRAKKNFGAFDSSLVDFDSR